MKKFMPIFLVFFMVIATFILSAQASQPVSSTPASSININLADAKKLVELKGVGEKKAQAIVTYRQLHGQFKSVNDLAQVKGIGEKSLVRILKNNPNRLTLK